MTKTKHLDKPTITVALQKCVVPSYQFRQGEATAQIGGDFSFKGEVVGSAFIVHDTIYNGVSGKALTGHRPPYKPIPIAKIIQNKGIIVYNQKNQ